MAGNAQTLVQFDRDFFDPEKRLTYIGDGSPGGKAQGLFFINDTLSQEFDAAAFQKISVTIPRFTVLRTGIFDAFMEQNDLFEIARSDAADDRIAHAFQNADFPARYIGDLRALVASLNTPVAVRSSSMLEDALHEPFAGIYETKMIPNNQPDIDTRFRKLIEAIKLVYASTFFKAAKDYRKATGHEVSDEKMAVIVQEVVGQRHQNRYYPEVSGVARSYNFYPLGQGRPEDGVVSLALGLGKTIVDGGRCWTYAPSRPKANPPYGSAAEWLKQTQTQFWAVNMGKPPAYDPIRETEYLLDASLLDAERDNTLKLIASTYDVQSERITPGTSGQGPRVLTFSPLLILNELPLNQLIQSLLAACERSLGSAVEIEFALTLKPPRFGFLQVRPMVVSDEKVTFSENEMTGPDVLLASEQVLGNGIVDSVQDVVYIRPEHFEAKFTPKIAAEIEVVNRALVEAGRPYLLIGFGRWGSSDPWLGVPVQWGQISGAKAIVEATLPHMDIEMSQGAHFFHNISNLRVSYFSVKHSGKYRIDWSWLDDQRSVTETQFLRHVKLPAPLTIKVDGRTGKGVIRKGL